MSQKYRILFVCMGNICRSPAAHIVMSQLVEDRNLNEQIEIDSAGTIGYHSGNAPDSRMSQTLKARGYNIFGAARQIVATDLEKFDLVLTMDDENFENVRRLDPSGKYADTLRKFTDFCEHFDDNEVPDPYYGGQKGFEHVADLVEDGCKCLLNKVMHQL